MTLNLTVPTRAGYTFAGWFTGNGINDGQVTSTTPIGQDMNLIAHWQINTLTVTFVGNDGRTLATRKVQYGKPAAAPDAPQVSKMKFSGWDKDFSKVKSDMTIKALYVADTYTVTYNTDGGTALAAQVYYMGDTPRQANTVTTSSAGTVTVPISRYTGSTGRSMRTPPCTPTFPKCSRCARRMTCSKSNRIRPQNTALQTTSTWKGLRGQATVPSRVCWTDRVSKFITSP